MSSCAILGASGHGKVIAEIAELNSYKKVEFFDDAWPRKKNIEHWCICGNTASLLEKISNYDLVVVGIGNNKVRIQKYQQLQIAGGMFDVLIHPTATVSSYAKLGVGTVVMANAVVNPFANIGRACIVNSSATVDHDCQLCDGVHISPGANLAGNVNIGASSWVGVGAQVRQSINIGREVVVGAGSTVIKDIPDFQTVVGTPAQNLIKTKL